MAFNTQAASYRGLKPTSALASKVGRGNRSSNTTPERLLRSAIHRLGGRYRIRSLGLPGRPDLVFPSAKVAVFCDGDFWHGRDWPRRRRMLARGANATYWISKIKRNRARDRAVDKKLKLLGWISLRVWESAIRQDPKRAARDILRLTKRRTTPIR
jgi:DNA mismatch endonuclease (patch repair protein)